MAFVLRVYMSLPGPTMEEGVNIPWTGVPFVPQLQKQAVKEGGTYSLSWRPKPFEPLSWPAMEEGCSFPGLATHSPQYL